MGLTYAVRAVVGVVILLIGMFIFWFPVAGARGYVIGGPLMLVGAILGRPPAENARLRRGLAVIGVLLLVPGILGALYYDAANAAAEEQDLGSPLSVRTSNLREFARTFAALGLILVVLNHSALGELTGKGPTAEKVEAPVEKAPEARPSVHAPKAEVKETPVKAPAPEKKGLYVDPLVAGGFILVVLVAVYVMNTMATTREGPYARIDTWGPTEYTLNGPGTLSATVTNYGTEAGTFVLTGFFLRNKGLVVVTKNSGWTLEEKDLTFTLDPGASKTVQAYRLTPSTAPTGEFGFVVRVFHLDGEGNKVQPEDHSRYQDLTVSG